MDKRINEKVSFVINGLTINGLVPTYELKWLKLLKYLLEEDSQLVALQISDTLFVYFDVIFVLYLPILKVSYV